MPSSRMNNTISADSAILEWPLMPQLYSHLSDYPYDRVLAKLKNRDMQPTQIMLEDPLILKVTLLLLVPPERSIAE